MILPRPIMPSFTMDLVEFYIQDKFVQGEEFKLCSESNGSYKFIGLADARGGRIVRAYVGGKNICRPVKIGLLKFYSHVTKNIGLIPDRTDEKLPPLVWLTSGIDGVMNVDRLCKAWAQNEGLLPRDGTKEGKALSDLLKESNELIIPNNPLDMETARAVINYLNYNLNKYGTDLTTLAEKSGPKLVIKGVEK